MTHGRQASFDRSAFSGRVRTRDRSAYVFAGARRPRPQSSVDGIIPALAKQSVRSARMHHQSHAGSKPALPRQSRSAVLARHTVVVKSKRKSAYAAGRSRKPVALVFMAAVLFVSGAGISYARQQADKKTAAQAKVLALSNETVEGGTVSEEAVSKEATASYAVAPEMPKLIKIPRLQVDARVKRVGISTAGVLETPANVHDAGWYEGSAKPGKDDVTLINGHVHGTTNPGVFSRLSILKEGDGIQIERGDGRVIEYKVVRTESADRDDIDLEKILAGGVANGKSSLVLISSSSRYDVRTNKYEQSFIVYAAEQ
jgi:LPXTG-site transpeptidase (sortase) family protein